MRIFLNGQEYSVPAQYESELMAKLLEEGKRDYHEKLSNKVRVMIKPGARALLLYLEMKEAKHLEAHGVPKEVVKQERLKWRPKDHEDANLLLAQRFAEILQGGLKYVDLYVSTDSGTITSFDLDIQSPGQAGGQLGPDRRAGSGQIDGAQIP